MRLPPATFDAVPAPEDGLRLAFVAARRRRNGKAVVAGGAGVAALALVLSMGGTAATQTLLQDPVPPAQGGPGRTATVEQSQAPAPRATPEVPQSRPSAAAAVQGTSSQVRLRPPAGAGDADAVRTPSTPAARASASPGRRSVVSRPMKRSMAFPVGGDPVCPVRKRQESSPSLCSDVYASEYAGTVTFSATLCSTETDPVRLSYPTEMELDIAVATPDGEVWRWSVGREIEDLPHTLVLEAGDCMVWTTEWAQVDQQGRRLPAGRYTVAADFQAAELPQTSRFARFEYRAR